MTMKESMMVTNPTISMFATTEHDPWFVPEQPPRVTEMDRFPDAFLRLDQPEQTIEGFGGCFSELGWTALRHLDQARQEEILQALFAPGHGVNLNSCRVPIGASDFALDWYSHDEVPGDFDLEHFSLARDEQHLIPFIQAAQRHQPDLAVWASPWSPPTWYKRNGHYACAVPNDLGEQTRYDNGLTPDRAINEGSDGIVLTPAVLDSYARYFGAFIDGYRRHGIDVWMVMPQNEFNSAQVFPSCTWTPEGLVAFLRHLVPEMEQRGVEVHLGTVERADPELAEHVLADPEIGRSIRGVGFQWAGKRAVPFVHRQHPDLTILQTEQECGDGRNDWRYARYAWSMMRHYFQHGANIYNYWNLALEEGGVSRWGWRQNSLCVVDPRTKEARLTHEFHVLRHLSGFVQPGARHIRALSYSGHENLLTFHNPDGSVVVAAQNDMTTPQDLVVGVGSRNVTVALPADSIVTVVVPAEYVEVIPKPLA